MMHGQRNIKKRIWYWCEITCSSTSFHCN